MPRVHIDMLKTVLEELRIQQCSSSSLKPRHTPSACDCKYGGDDIGKRTLRDYNGCPELRYVVDMLSTMTNEDLDAIENRARGMVPVDEIYRLYSKCVELGMKPVQDDSNKYPAILFFIMEIIDTRNRVERSLITALQALMGKAFKSELHKDGE